jgi:hypothetical protein
LCGVSRLSSSLLSRLGVARGGGFTGRLRVLASRSGARLGGRGGFLGRISRLACLSRHVCNPRSIGERRSFRGRASGAGGNTRVFSRVWRLRRRCLGHSALRVAHLGNGRLRPGGVLYGRSVSVLGSLCRFLCLFGDGFDSAQGFSDNLIRFTVCLTGRVGCFLRQTLGRASSGRRF